MNFNVPGVVVPRPALALVVAVGAAVVIGSAPAALADPAAPTESPTPAAPTESPTPAAPTVDASPTTDPVAPGDPVDLGLVPVFPGDPIVRGAAGGLSFDVTGVSPGASLALTVPPALTVVSAQLRNDTDVSCAPSTGAVVCDLGAVTGLDLLNLTFAAAPTTPIGTQLRVAATVTPVPGPESNPGDNSSSGEFTVVGNADVDQSFSVPQVDLPVGGTGTFTITLHNNGPDPATNLETSLAVQSKDEPRPELVDFSAPVAPGNGFVTWRAGTLAAGATATLTVTISAPGVVADSFVSIATGYDGRSEICDGSPFACLPGVRVRTSGAAADSGPELAATGADPTALLVTATGLLLAGGVVAFASRRRRAV